MKTIFPDEIKLNPEQKQAVEYSGRPLLIIAGAGTGKTTVVTERIKHLITQKLAKPAEILALTFTEKSAREMEERVDIALPYGYTQMWISTFHSFCDRVLRDEAIQIGLNPAYKLLTDTDVIMFLRNHLFEFKLDYFRPLGNPTKFLGGMTTHFSRLRDEDITPEQYLAWVKSQISSRPRSGRENSTSQTEEERWEIQKYTELAHAYKAYTQLKEKEGFLDFSDLIGYTLELFRRRPNILKKYQQQFKFLLVDEFQDTNIAQNELIILLAGKEQNVTAVADDDQSIYKFRGAAVSNVIQFRKHFSRAKLIVLSKNYRSTQTILDKSYRLIQHNNPDRLEIKEGISKKLEAVRNIPGEPVRFLRFDRVENEADACCKEIRKIVSGEDSMYSYKDVAILLRANNHAEPFVRALIRHGVPFQFLGPGQLFRQPEVKELVAYLQVLANFEDNVAFFKVLSMDYFAISPRDLAALINFSRRHILSLFEAAEVVAGLRQQENMPLLFISEATKTKIAEITAMIHRHLKLLTRETGGQILYYFLEDTGILKSVLEFTYPVDEKKAGNVMKFFNRLKTYESEHADASVQAVLDWILLSMEMGESPRAADTDWTDNDAVNILTVHSAKGLEFGVVFLANLVSQRFPTVERREQIPIPDALIKEELPQGDYHTEEERRLFYVGMTRARDKLYLTAANFYGEGKREKKISPFVYEALGDDVIETPIVQSDQLSLLDWRKTEMPEPPNREPVHISYLSYSQIEAFRICPLHYKLGHILKIPVPASPALSFGSSVHAALKDFYQAVIRGESVTKDVLFSLLEKNWQRGGYTSKRYEQEMWQRGLRYLGDYFDKAFDKHNKPLLLEQPFTVPITAQGRILKIGGRIDRVDKVNDGRIEIIDYKTGRLPSQREVDANLQLSMYALAATEISEPPFGKKVDEVILTLYYFDVQEKMSTRRTTTDLIKTQETIISIARDIETSDFKCSGGKFCTNCEYAMFCGVSYEA